MTLSTCPCLVVESRLGPCWDAVIHGIVHSCWERDGVRCLQLRVRRVATGLQSCESAHGCRRVPNSDSGAPDQQPRPPFWGSAGAIVSALPCGRPCHRSLQEGPHIGAGPLLCRPYGVLPAGEWRRGPQVNDAWGRRVRQHRTAIDVQSNPVCPALKAAEHLARVRQDVHGSLQDAFESGPIFSRSQRDLFGAAMPGIIQRAGKAVCPFSGRYYW